MKKFLPDFCPFELHFVKLAKTGMSNISNHMFQPHKGYVTEHVCAWYGLVDARVFTLASPFLFIAQV
jgi:hypothetical protein